MAKRLLRREHIVAASLVGSVVVVIGFASGLGSRPGTGASAAPAPDDHPPATAPVTTTQTQAPQGHSTGGGYSGGGAVPVATGTEPPPGNDYTGHPMPPATTTTPPATTTTPPATCQPGFVPTALDTLLGTLGRATDALGLGAAPGLIGTTMAVLPALPEGTPLDQFVATCPTPAPTAPTPTAPTTTTPVATGHGG